jgi:hypothetical protein
MIGAAFAFVLKLVTGGGGLADQLRLAHKDRIAAQTQTEVLVAQTRVHSIEASIAAARLANEDRWSATSLGRYLIVVPFGVWWTAVFLDSTFGFAWDPLALPAKIDAMARILIPAIVIADAGALSIKSLRR